jgi:hypothetical protein
VGCTAGEGIANFSSRIHDHDGEVLLDTQMGQLASMSVAAIAPDGGVRRAGEGSAPYPTLPYAGPMRSVLATGRIALASAAIETEHELLPSLIHLRWKMTLPKGGSWEVSLPSYGTEAEILLRGSSGSTALRQGGSPHSLSEAGQITIKASAGSYLLEVIGREPRAVLRLAQVPPRSGASMPGPSLLIEGRKEPAGGTVELALRLRVA